MELEYKIGFGCERACSSVVALAVASLPTRVRSPAGTTCGVAPGINSPERTGHCVGRVCVWGCVSACVCRGRRVPRLLGQSHLCLSVRSAQMPIRVLHDGPVLLATFKKKKDIRFSSPHSPTPPPFQFGNQQLPPSP